MSIIENYRFKVSFMKSTHLVLDKISLHETIVHCHFKINTFLTLF